MIHALVPARTSVRTITSAAIFVFSLWLSSSLALAAGQLPNPQLHRVFPAGARQGTTVKVQISGLNLDEAETLIFSHPGIKAVPGTTPPRFFEKSPQPVSGQFVITVGADVPPGTYECRALGRFGVSSPRAFEVGDLPEVQSSGANNTTQSAMSIKMGTVANGRVASTDATHFYKFTAKAGEQVLIRAATGSIDSRMSALLELLNADANAIAFGRETKHRDAAIHFVSPADGDYFVKLSDATFQGGNDYVYRLEVSHRPSLDYLWPPVATAGKTGNFQLYGYDLPGGVSASASDGNQGLQKLSVQIPVPKTSVPFSLTAASKSRNLIENELDGFEYRLRTGELPSNALFLKAAVAPLVLEKEPNNEPEQSQKVSLPCEVVGRLTPNQDSDWFSFEGVAGVKYELEIFSERMNLPTDPITTVYQLVKDAKGKETAKRWKEVDDLRPFLENAPFEGRTHDSPLDFVARTTGTYRVHLRDLYGSINSSARNAYSLVIRKARGDFRLVATAKEISDTKTQENTPHATALNLRRSGTQPLLIQAYRQAGYEGPIELSATGLPPGVTCLPISIPAGEDQATLVFEATSDAALWHGTIRIQGTADIDGQKVQHQALAATIIWDKNNANELATTRIMDDLALAVIPEVAPLNVVPAEEKVLETVRGAKLSIPAKFEHHLASKGKMKVEVRGLPPALYPAKKLPVNSFDAKATEGAIEVTMNPKLTPGDYPCYLVAQTLVAYARNPEAAKAAEKEKQELENLIKQLKTEQAAAESKQKAAEKKVSELTPKAADPAKEKAIAAAQAAKVKATEEAKAVSAKLKAAQDELPKISKRAGNLAKAAKPKDTDVFAVSHPVVIRVREVPIDIAIATPKASPQGTQSEVTVTVKRLFGFQGEVKLESQPPSGITGLSVAGATIPASGTSVKLFVKTTAQTPVGTHRIQIRSKMSFNGQKLQSESHADISVVSAAEVVKSEATP